MFVFSTQYTGSIVHNFGIEFQHVRNKTIGFHTRDCTKGLSKSGGSQQRSNACLAGIYNKDDVLRRRIWKDLVLYLHGSLQNQS